MNLTTPREKRVHSVTQEQIKPFILECLLFLNFLSEFVLS